MGAIQMRGLRTMLGICSIDVPMPWLTRPPQRFSRKLITAKPTICAQQPATAAPPARPGKPKHRADGRGGDGQRERDAHQHRYHDAHPEGLQLAWPASISMPNAEAAPADRRRDQLAPAPRRRMIGHRGRDQRCPPSSPWRPPCRIPRRQWRSAARPAGRPRRPRALAAQPTAASENSTIGGACSA